MCGAVYEENPEGLEGKGMTACSSGSGKAVLENDL